MQMTGKTLGETEKNIRQLLEGMYGKRESSGIARIILEYLTGKNWTYLLANREKELGGEHVQSLEKILDNLKSGTPVQYALGETEFYGLVMKVSPSVLIPRQETEELVDWIIKDPLFNQPERQRVAVDPGNGGNGGPQSDKAFRILDIGTGSGCIAIALKKNLPDTEVWACDVSAGALDIAGKNAAIHQAAITFREANILDSSVWPSFPSFDIIVSNPPYVTRAEQKEMAAHVLQYEPHLALFVENDDPLRFYRHIAGFALQKLRPRGKLYFEINEAYGKEILGLLRETGFSGITLRKDLNGKDRMLRACARSILGSDVKPLRSN